MNVSTLEVKYLYLRKLLAERTQNDAAALRSFDRCYAGLAQGVPADSSTAGLAEVPGDAPELTFRQAVLALVDEFNDCLPADAESLEVVFTE